jgi:hypothetical protein
MSELLTDQERIRLMRWLEHEAATESGLLAQMKTLGPAFAILMKHKEAEIAALLLIAGKLRNTESMSIGAKP